MRTLRLPLNVIAAVALALGVVACASGTTTVVAPTEAKTTFASAQFERGDDTVEVKDEYAQYFGAKLFEAFFEEGAFAQGEELTVRYRFIQLDKGSQAKRYFIGFGAGKGSLTIEAVFLNPNGEELSKINVGGEISVGFFGGSFQEALAKAADEVAEYAATNFLDAAPE
ncbi:MAG: DUF4410 domain-containing protein [Pseudomonadota bacterium]